MGYVDPWQIPTPTRCRHPVSRSDQGPGEQIRACRAPE